MFSRLVYGLIGPACTMRLPGGTPELKKHLQVGHELRDLHMHCFYFHMHASLDDCVDCHMQIGKK